MNTSQNAYINSGTLTCSDMQLIDNKIPEAHKWKYFKTL